MTIAAGGSKACLTTMMADLHAVQAVMKQPDDLSENSPPRWSTAGLARSGLQNAWAPSEARVLTFAKCLNRSIVEFSIVR